MKELRKLRNKLGYKREYVAEKMGISPDHLNVLERGACICNIIQIDKLSKIYNISLAEVAEMALRTAKKE